MLLLFSSQFLTLFQHAVAIACTFVVFIGVHALADAHKWLKKTQDIYNSQPRVKKMEVKLKWPARLIAFITFRKL